MRDMCADLAAEGLAPAAQSVITSTAAAAVSGFGGVSSWSDAARTEQSTQAQWTVLEWKGKQDVRAFTYELGAPHDVIVPSFWEATWISKNNMWVQLTHM